MPWRSVWTMKGISLWIHKTLTIQDRNIFQWIHTGVQWIQVWYKYGYMYIWLDIWLLNGWQMLEDFGTEKTSFEIIVFVLAHEFVMIKLHCPIIADLFLLLLYFVVIHQCYRRFSFWVSIYLFYKFTICLCLLKVLLFTIWMFTCNVFSTPQVF